MTIEKANKDFNQLIEQNGFINTGTKTPTGCKVYVREWNRKVQVAVRREHQHTRNQNLDQLWHPYGVGDPQWADRRSHQGLQQPEAGYERHRGDRKMRWI